MLSPTVVALAVALSSPVSSPAVSPTTPDLPTLLGLIAAKEDRASTVIHQWGYTLKIHDQRMDRKGALTSDETAIFRRTHSGTKAIDDISYDVKNGKDILVEERKKEAKLEKEGKNTDSDIVGPFATAQQPLYEYKLLGPDPSDPSRVRIAFTPHTATTKTLTGTAVVDRASGRIRSVEAVPARLPTLVSEFKISMEYGNGTDETPLLSTLRIHGEIGLFFLRQRFDAVTEFSDFAPPTR